MLGLVGLDLAEVVVQAFEALFPMAAVLVHPVRDVAQRARPQPARSPLRLATLLDETGPLEHPQVLRDRGLAHVERGGQLLDRGLALARRARIARRVGSARAANVVLSWSVGCMSITTWLYNLWELYTSSRDVKPPSSALG